MHLPISRSFSRGRVLLVPCVLLLLAWAAGPLRGAEPPKIHFDIPADLAENALKRFAAQAGLEVLFATKTAGQVRTNAVRGDYTAREAIALLLSDTGLAAAQDEKTGALTVTKTPASAPPPQPEKKSAGDEVVVMSPFVARGTNDRGYLSTNSAAITRLDSPVRDLPMNVQIINQEMMADLGVTAPADLTRFMVGAENGGINPWTTGYNLRGFVALPDDQQRDGFRFYNRVNLYNIDRVEIILGPNSVVQGAADPGGQVNVITKSALARQNFTTVTAKAGSYGGYRGTVDHNLSWQTERNDFALRTNLLYEESPTFVKFSYDTYKGIALAGKADLDRATTIEAKFEYLHEHRMPTSAIPDRWSGGPGLHGGFSQALNRTIPQLYTVEEGNALIGPDAYETLENLYGLAEVTHTFTDRLRVKLIGQASRENTPDILSGGVGQALGYNAATNTYYVNRTTQWQSNDDKRFNLRFLVNYDLDLGWTEQKFIVGYSYMQTQDFGLRDFMYDATTNARVLEQLPISPGGVTAANYRIDLTNRYWRAAGITFNRVWNPSYYFNTTGSYLGGRLKTVLGFAYTGVTRTDYFYNTPATGSLYEGTAVIPGVDHSTSFTSYTSDPMVSVVYAVTPEVNVYANFSKSFKPQTSFNPTINLTTGEVGQAVLPLTGVGYETGFKFDFPRTGWSGSVSLYHVKQINIPQSVDTAKVEALLGLTASLLQRYFVPGVEQTDKGVEVQLFYNPSRSWSIMANGAYNDAEVTKSVLAPELLGQEANTHFKLSGNLVAKYTFVDGPLQGWFLGANAFARGRTFRFQGVEKGYNPGFIVAGALVGYAGRLGDRPYTVQLNIDNIFNKIYIRNYAEIGAPRQWFVSASLKL
jgi:outer membrane receptor protein involved in Fe transport